MMYPVPCRPNHGMTVTVLTCPNASVLSRTIRAVKIQPTSCSSTSYTKERCSSNQKTIRHAINAWLNRASHTAPTRTRTRTAADAQARTRRWSSEEAKRQTLWLGALLGSGTGTDSNNKLAYCVVDAVSADLGIPGSTPSTTAPIPVDTDSDTAVAGCTAAAEENLLGAPAEQAAISTTQAVYAPPRRERRASRRTPRHGKKDAVPWDGRA